MINHQRAYQYCRNHLRCNDADALTGASFSPLTQKKPRTRVVNAQIAAGANGRFRFAFGAQIEIAGSSIGADGRHQSEVTGPPYRAPRMPPRNPDPHGRRHLSTRPFERSSLTQRLEHLEPERRSQADIGP